MYFAYEVGVINSYYFKTQWGESPSAIRSDAHAHKCRTSGKERWIWNPWYRQRSIVLPQPLLSIPKPTYFWAYTVAAPAIIASHEEIALTEFPGIRQPVACFDTSQRINRTAASYSLQTFEFWRIWQVS